MNPFLASVYPSVEVLGWFVAENLKGPTYIQPGTGQTGLKPPKHDLENLFGRQVPPPSPGCNFHPLLVVWDWGPGDSAQQAPKKTFDLDLVVFRSQDTRWSPKKNLQGKCPPSHPLTGPMTAQTPSRAFQIHIHRSGSPPEKASWPSTEKTAN